MLQQAKKRYHQWCGTIERNLLAFSNLFPTKVDLMTVRGILKLHLLEVAMVCRALVSISPTGRKKQKRCNREKQNENGLIYGAKKWRVESRIRFWSFVNEREEKILAKSGNRPSPETEKNCKANTNLLCADLRIKGNIPMHFCHRENITEDLDFLKPKTENS